MFVNSSTAFTPRRSPAASVTSLISTVMPVAGSGAGEGSVTANSPMRAAFPERENTRTPAPSRYADRHDETLPSEKARKRPLPYLPCMTRLRSAVRGFTRFHDPPRLRNESMASS